MTGSHFYISWNFFFNLKGTLDNENGLTWFRRLLGKVKAFLSRDPCTRLIPLHRSARADLAALARSIPWMPLPYHSSHCRSNDWFLVCFVLFPKISYRKNMSFLSECHPSSTHSELNQCFGWMRSAYTALNKYFQKALGSTFHTLVTLNVFPPMMYQWSPTFLAPRNGFMENNFFTTRRKRWVGFEAIQRYKQPKFPT